MENKITKSKLISIIMFLAVFIFISILLFINKDSLVYEFHKNFIDNNNYLELLKGLFNTILITFVSFVIGLIIGALICLIQGLNTNNTVLLIMKNIANAYVSIFRGTPATVQLLIIYFVIFASFRGDAIYIAMITFGLNSGAYVSEILRGGINSISKGQMEAGRSLGLSYGTTMKKIILPQAIRNALPSLGNEFITLIKETSIVGFIGAIDLTLAFRKIDNDTYDFEIVYIMMGIIYFLIVLFITILLRKLEKRLMNNVKVK